MSVIDQITQKAKGYNQRIAFPEATEPRTLKAVSILTDQSICRCILVGNHNEIQKAATENGIQLSSRISIIDPSSSDRNSDYTNEFFNLRKAKGQTHEQARERMKDPLFFAAMMVRRGDADGAVAGAITTTADVLRAGIQVIGLKEGNRTVSSVFLMNLPGGKVVTYGDCAVVPYPDAAQLADIAIASADTHQALTGEIPRVAMLSFSTKGSAAHEAVTKVTDALALVTKMRPGLAVDGELQFDAAWVAAVGQRKAPGSEVAGKANVFVFPNLDAGNIGYKITERVGGADAIGPIIQGLAKPLNDLSRGCKAEDIVTVAAVCAVKAKENR